MQPREAALQNYRISPLTTYAFILLSTVSLASIVTASDSALCPIPSPAPKHVPAAGKDALALLQSFQLTAATSSATEKSTSQKKERVTTSPTSIARSLCSPHSVERTDDDSGLLHVAATLTLFGVCARLLLGPGRRQRHSYVDGHTVSFYLSGYYSTSGELCMTGAGK